LGVEDLEPALEIGRLEPIAELLRRDPQSLTLIEDRQDESFGYMLPVFRMNGWWEEALYAMADCATRSPGDASAARGAAARTE
jgi:hypothetical protein